MLQTETILTQEHIEPFRQWLKDRGRGTLTVKAYSTDLRVFFLEMKLTSIPIIDLETTAASWLNKTRRVTEGSDLPVVSAKTTNRRLTSLRSFGLWLGLHILEDYSGPTAPKVIPSAFPEGIEAVREILQNEDRIEVQALIALIGLCGLRISEARSLGPEDFDLVLRVIRVHGKGDKERFVPFTDEAFGYFAVLLAITPPGEPLVKLQDRWARKLITRAGFSTLDRPVASHDFRKTFGTEVNNKSGLRAAQELLGHASSRTTEGYTLVTFETMRAAVEAI